VRNFQISIVSAVKVCKTSTSTSAASPLDARHSLSFCNDYLPVLRFTVVSLAVERYDKYSSDLRKVAQKNVRSSVAETLAVTVFILFRQWYISNLLSLSLSIGAIKNKKY